MNQINDKYFLLFLKSVSTFFFFEKKSEFFQKCLLREITPLNTSYIGKHIEYCKKKGR